MNQFLTNTIFLLAFLGIVNYFLKTNLNDSEIVTFRKIRKVVFVCILAFWVFFNYSLFTSMESVKQDNITNQDVSQKIDSDRVIIINTEDTLEEVWAGEEEQFLKESESRKKKFLELD